MTMTQKSTAPWSVAVFATIAGIAFSFVIATALAYRHVFGTAVSTLSGEWNNFGTFFGGVLGPILSMLAFFALVYTIFLQEQQLSMARSTLKAADEDKELTRRQLDTTVATQTATANALETQLQTSREQSAVATFFEMVKLHHEIVSQLNLWENHGRAVLSMLYTRDLTADHKTAANEHGYGRIADGAAGDLFLKNNPNLGIYFRNLYRIYKYVDENDVGDKFDLTGLLRAQLSEHELALLFYNGLSASGSEFKILMERYAMFEHLTMASLFTRESTGFYEPAAFKTTRPT